MSKKAARLVQSTSEFEGVLTWNFSPVGGVTPEPLEFSVKEQWTALNKLYPIGAKAMMHGFKQKISDAGAMSADTNTGKVDPAARIAKMRRVAEALANGDWELQRTGGGATGGMLAQAIAEAFGKDLAVAREFLKGKSEAEKTALRAHKPIAEILARMEAEAASQIDAGAMLAGLIGPTEPEGEGEEGEETPE